MHSRTLTLTDTPKEEPEKNQECEFKASRRPLWRRPGGPNAGPAPRDGSRGRGQASAAAQVRRDGDAVHVPEKSGAVKDTERMKPSKQVLTEPRSIGQGEEERPWH